MRMVIMIHVHAHPKSFNKRRCILQSFAISTFKNKSVFTIILQTYRDEDRKAKNKTKNRKET